MKHGLNSGIANSGILKCTLTIYIYIFTNHILNIKYYRILFINYYIFETIYLKEKSVDKMDLKRETQKF